MTYKLNGINYTEMLLTDEELAVVKAMRSKEDNGYGCLKCSGCTLISENNFNIIVNDDLMRIAFKKEFINLQITYCPFCGKKL